MARRPVALIPGRLAALLVALLCLGPLVPLLLAGGGGLAPADWAALRFTLWQAALSAALSAALAVPVARALARRAFAGRAALVALLGAPFLLPALAAVLGLLALFGRGGIVSDALAALGLPRLSIYGAGGVVLAHVFLNLPLATRLLLAGWEAIPAERFRLAATLDAPVWRLLERPMLARALPGTVATVFALSLASFAVALTLGGGPAATTVELAIYQALRFEADFAGAATLALVQYAIGGAAAALAWALAPPPPWGAGRGRPVARWDAGGRLARWGDAAALALASAFLLLPLGAAALRGLAGLAELPAGTGRAALNSLLVALGAALACLVLALPLALRGGALARLAGSLPLAASALVLGTGAALLLRPLVAPSALALPLAALVDGLLALPFAVALLGPAAEEAEARHGRLADALRLGGWARLRLLHLPLLRPALGLSLGLAAALSAGSLGVVALLGGDEATLPLLAARLLGAYRTEAAAAVTLLALLLGLALLLLFDLWGRRAAA